MVTLYDVARKAGVSMSTVSYVLNGKKKVKAETKMRIFNAVEELNYLPNQMAVGLKKEYSNCIGVVVSDALNMFYIDIIRAIEYEVKKHGYSVLLYDTGLYGRNEIMGIQQLLSFKVSGMFFIGAVLNKFSAQLREIKIPVVTIDRKHEGIASVNVDHISGAYKATSYLIKNKWTPIAMIAYSSSYKTIADRIYGYKKALKDAGFEYDEKLIIETEPMDYQEGYIAVNDLLKKNLDFKSVFTCSDMLALGALKAFFDVGYKVPEDVRVIGYDNLKISKLFNPSLTTIEQPKFCMGEEAAKLMMDLINNQQVKENNIIFEPELIIRQSG